MGWEGREIPGNPRPIDHLSSGMTHRNSGERLPDRLSLDGRQFWRLESARFEGSDIPLYHPERTAMSRETTLQRILDGGIVAVVRSESPDQLVGVVRALAEGGVTAAEITFTVPDAIEVIRQVRKALGDSIILGAGSVLDPETARAALLAGAEYIVGPSTNLEVIRLCRRYGKVVMPGALTPTEVVTAWEAGADIVKI